MTMRSEWLTQRPEVMTQRWNSWPRGQKCRPTGGNGWPRGQKCWPRGRKGWPKGLLGDPKVFLVNMLTQRLEFSWRSFLKAAWVIFWIVNTIEHFGELVYWIGYWYLLTENPSSLLHLLHFLNRVREPQIAMTMAAMMEITAITAFLISVLFSDDSDDSSSHQTQRIPL